MPTPTPDDICLVCSETRENHGDKRHEFSEDGQLRASRPAEKPRQTPPTLQAHELAEQMSIRLMLRLVERMIERDLLTGDDMTYIFGQK